MYYFKSHDALRLICILTTACAFTFSANADIDETLQAQNVFDTTAPHIFSNVPERVCVVDLTTDPDFVANDWQSTFVQWLNDSPGWEQIGGFKVKFESNCTSPNILLEFHDPASSTYEARCGFYDAQGALHLAGACAEAKHGSYKTFWGENHYETSKIYFGSSFYTCNGHQNFPCFWPIASDGMKRVLMHEVGHLMGLNHGGPAWGIVGGGDDGIWESHFDTSPIDSEIYMARAGLNGSASPALRPCMGFPEQDKIQISWFDTAKNEISNGFSFWVFSGGSWQHLFDSSVPAANNPAYGSRVTYTSQPMTVANGQYTARMDITGGASGSYAANWDPVIWSPSVSPSNSYPNSPCTLDITAHDGGGVSLNWEDSSYNETGWQLYYSVAVPGGNGELGPWNYRGQCTGANIETCGDNASYTPLFNPGDLLCARISAINSNGESGYSNVACALTKP